MDKARKENEEFKDEFISKIIEEGSYVISNESFEDQILQKIHTHVDDKEKIISKIKLSLKFFCVGLGLIFVCLLGFIFRDFFSNQSTNTNTFVYVLFLFFSTIMGILSIENYKRVINNFSF